MGSFISPETEKTKEEASRKAHFIKLLYSDSSIIEFIRSREKKEEKGEVGCEEEKKASGKWLGEGY